MKKTCNFFFLSTFLFCFSQNNQIIDLKWDGKNPFEINHKIYWINKSNQKIKSIFLIDWNNSYSSMKSNLGLKLAEEFDYRLIRSNKNDRGFTKIKSVLFKNQKLKWKRLDDNSDIIKIELIDYLKPGEKILFSVIYEIKLPNSRVFKYGMNKHKDVFTYNWHLSVAKINKSGDWEIKNNNGYGQKPIDKSTTNYSINIPNSYNLLIPKNGFTAKQNNIPLIISNKSKIKSYNFGDNVLITDMNSSDLSYEDVEKIFKKIIEYTGRFFPKQNEELFWSIEKDYDKKPIPIIKNIPKILGAFSNFKLFELKILKTSIDRKLIQKFGYQTDDEWIIDAISGFLFNNYLNEKYPKTKLMGNLDRLAILKKYNFIHAPFYRSFEIAGNISANKNRGQSISSEIDDLTRYNREIANPSRGTMSLIYLNEFLEDDLLIDVIKELNSSTSVLVDIRNKIAGKTNKPIDWFFDNYINQNNNPDLKLEVKKIDEVNYTIKAIESTKSNDLPLVNLKNKFELYFPLFTEYEDGDYKKKWINTSNLITELNPTKSNIKSVIIDKNHLIPERQVSNNSYSFQNKFLKNNLKFRLFQDIPKSGSSILLVSPEFGYNLYDGFITGINLGNSSLLAEKIKFKINPSYGTLSNKLNGLGYLIYSKYKNGSSNYMTRLSVFGSSFHYADNSRYISLNPTLKYFFRANGLKDNLRSSLTFKHTSIRLHNKSENSERKSYGVTSVSYQKNTGNALKNIFLNSELQLASRFKKIKAEAELIKYFLPNRRVSLRLFGGYFFSNKNSDNYFDFGVSRVNDYLFQYDLYGRSESDGIYSQQYIKADGAMKTSNYYETADKLMITSLVSTTIWKWIEGYFELGFIKNKKFVHEYHWGSGLSLNIIPDFFEIHFPIADSSGSIYKNNFYSKKIRLQLSLRPSTISKLFSRSWF